MALLHFFEEIRFDELNEFMLFITQLGDVLAFLVIALVVFWCVDKRWGYYVLSVGLIGTILNQFMKILFRIPRPWILDEKLSVVGLDGAGADGYSFPSGHTQSAVGVFGSLACLAKARWIRISAIVLAVLVSVSRMYLGVHTPLDVFVAAAMAVILLIIIRPLVFHNNGKYMPILICISAAMSVGFLCFMEFYSFPETVDHENYTHALENAYTLLGAMLGVLVVYFADQKWLRFPVKAVWWVQIIKVALGLLLVLLVMEGTSAPLKTAFGPMIGRCIRYFLTVITAGAVWPLTFRFWGRIGMTRKGNKS